MLANNSDPDLASEHARIEGVLDRKLSVNTTRLSVLAWIFPTILAAYHLRKALHPPMFDLDIYLSALTWIQAGQDPYDYVHPAGAFPKSSCSQELAVRSRQV